MTRVLVTGINGFIGAHVAHRLAGRGWRIAGADVQRYAAGPCDDYVSVDLGAAGADAALRSLPRADFIVHCGGISGFMVEQDNPARIFDVNVGGTARVLELARQWRTRRIVICSTIMVYGPGQGADLDEDLYPMPISVYGASKVAAEALMLGYHGQYGVDGIALRFSHVYGPGRTTECFVRDMLSAAAAGRPCSVAQAPGSQRQYVHIEDVSDSLERALDAAAPARRIFNISADESHTLSEVALAVARTVKPLQVTFDPTRDLPNYRIGKLSIAAARRVLGYAPRYDLEAGLRAYWSQAFASSSA